MNNFDIATQIVPKVHPLSDAGGAIISDIDLRSPIPEEVEEMLRSAWRNYLVLVIRDLNIEEQHQESFCKIFGNLAGLRSKVYRAGGDTKSHALWVANAEDSSRPTAVQQGEMMFHIDQCYTERPSKASTLYAVGNTRFSNLIKAYEGLSDDWKMRIEGLKALNYFDYQANATTRPETIDPNGPQFVHPIVRTHPETGRKSLFVNRQMTMFIDGLGANESDEILNYLFEMIEDPSNVYEHIWKVGDLVLWDNRCTAHARTYYNPKEPRLLRRMTVLDESPVK